MKWKPSFVTSYEGLSISVSNQLLLRRYLLGDLPDEQAQRFEEEFFADDEQFSELLAAEDDLIDAFLEKRLSAADRQRFESRFLTTERGRQKIALGSLLRPALREQSVAMPWIAVAAIVAVLVIAAGLVRELATTRSHIDELEHERASLRSGMAALTTQMKQLQTAAAHSPEPPKVFSIMLQGLERGTSSATMILPADAAAADLWLVLPRDAYPRYSATLQTVDGAPLWHQSSLTSRPVDGRKGILLQVPASMLQPHTFTIAVSGEKPDGTREPVEDFSFTIRRP